MFAAGARVPEVSRALKIGLSTVYAWRSKWAAGGIGRLERWHWTQHEDKPLTAREREVLDGLMLGDGCLFMGSSAKNACLTITRAAADMGYLRWTADTFSTRLTSESLTARDVTDARTGRTHGRANLRTRNDPAFTPERQRWYPQGIKRIPCDLHLSPLIMAVWFADDGWVGRASLNTVAISLATNGFPQPDVHFLAELLTVKLGIEFRVHREAKGRHFVIKAYGDAARALLREIDPVFPPLARKSDRWRNSKALNGPAPVAPRPDCPRCGSTSVRRWARARNNGVQQFKCMDCTRVFRETYERAGRDPRGRGDAA
jgi:hypothetical protein